ncbi:hypothetical protein GCM10010213_01470 [Microbacterium maritypicum]|uniref:Uncharacterized protein n=1 Tax=Microbacterium maritypicum TaxID=33918 RepID=A0A4Y4B0J3_MICMQ|nr:hypothetical protein MLI01_01460 [Microbacterium liquefaciens]GGV48620.1 hypothetical protein GCM10010213_01470 [Microbacterium liquefaciens]
MRGAAIGQPCAAPDCATPADGWGLIAPPTVFGKDGGRAVAWSRDLGDYAPLCKRHNGQKDGGGNWTWCPRGHVRTVWGTDSHGHCVGCQRERNREYRALQKSRRLAGSTPTQGTITEQNGGQS